MGNTSCCFSCSPSQKDYQDVIDNLFVVKKMSHINELISYIDQLLNVIGQGSINSIDLLAKTNRVASSIDSGAGLLEKLLKRSNTHTCKRDIVPKFNRETRKLVIDVTNEAAKIKWVGAVLSVVGFVLERIEQVSSNREDCIELLRYMCNLAKYIKQLDDHLSQEKLNRVLHFIVEGSLLCISQMQSHALSKFFAAPVAAEDLRRLQRQLGQEYSELSLESIIAVLNRIPVVLPPSQGTSPQAVGIEEARNRVTELLDMKSQSVKVVVIYGQGGIGKTTLATAVFSKLDLQNYKYCRVDMEQNCSEANLKLLQQQILRDLYELNIELRNLNEGCEELSKGFKERSTKPVFIFVDNALRQNDLEKLLPVIDFKFLPPQSRILITTRNLNETLIILQGGVERCPYQVASLPQEEAQKLLCKLALSSGQASFDPTIDINGLLKICQGIPLVLKMVGARLREHAQSVPACKETVEYLKSELLKGVQDELSERMVDFVYNRLDASSKEAFLDIVFFFCNWERQRVVSSVGATEFGELEKAALVNITDEGMVNVHDIVKARGIMLSPEGVRITDLQSLTDVLQDVERIKKIKGIVLCQRESFEMEAYHLNLMKKCLRVLILTESTRIVNGEWKGVFENLRLLSLENHNNYSWMDVSKHPRLTAIILEYERDSNFPEFAGSIPSSLRYVYIKGVVLVNLTITHSQIQSLHYLTLRNCSGFESLPETISNLLALEELHLRSCSSLGSLPDSFGSLSSLNELYLEYCSSLVSLSDSFGSLSFLKQLNLRACSSLVSLPDSFGSLSSLKQLNLRSCKSLVSLPDSFGSLSSLNELYLQFCSSLVSLPDSFGSLSSLNELYLESCSSLVSLPDSFGSLSSLKQLNLRSCSSLVSLPDSFGSLSSLKQLNLRSCSSLVSLPDSFGSLSSLNELYLESCSSLVSLPDSFGSLSSLNELYLESCSSLVRLPDSFGSLSPLNELYLESCSSLVSLPNSFGSLSSLKQLNLRSCSSLVSLPDNFGSLSSLKQLNLESCSSLVNLPDSFGSLSSLNELYLESCSSLVSLPDSFGSLSSLKSLNLRSCLSLASLPDSFGSLSSFKKLDLMSCSSLMILPNSFGSLSSLEKLDLSFCSSLVSLPDSFGNLYGLVNLYLIRCTQLSLLPESFGNLASLKRLVLQDCEKLWNLPQNFGELKCLKFVSVNGCSVLQSLSGDFECLSSLIAVKASECSQLEENTMDKLAKMEGLMVVHIEGSPMLKKRWEQVKEQYSLAVVECGSKELRSEMYPFADVMCRAFCHSESKFVHVDENGQLRDSACLAGGVKLWILLKESDVNVRDSSSSSSNSSGCWEAVKKKWMELVGSEGGQMIYVDMGGSWEERERRVQQALPHLPSGTRAWIAPDNRARLSFAYSVQHYYKTCVREGNRKAELSGLQNCIMSTSLYVDEEGRRKLDDLNFIIPDLSTKTECKDFSDQLLSPIEDAIRFLVYF